MSFVVWIALGLAAGSIGGRLEKKGEESILPDILMGVVGAVAGGWSFYTFGAAGKNGLNLLTHFAAVTGSLAFLLTYYFIKQFSLALDLPHF